MGQYYKVVNLDKQQFISPHKLGDGLKLMEFGSSSEGTLTALAFRLAQRSQDNSRSWEQSGVFGSWAGDRAVIAGDYADEGRFCPPGAGTLNLYSLCADQYSGEDTDPLDPAVLIADASDATITELAKVAPGLAASQLDITASGWRDSSDSSDVTYWHRITTLKEMRSKELASLTHLFEFMQMDMPVPPTYQAMQLALSELTSRLAAVLTPEFGIHYRSREKQVKVLVDSLVTIENKDHSRVKKVTFDLTATWDNNPPGRIGWPHSIVRVSHGQLTFPCTFEKVVRLIGRTFKPLGAHVAKLVKEEGTSLSSS